MPNLTVLGALTRPRTKSAAFQTVEQSRGWYPLTTVREGYPGAWQQNVVGRTEDILGYAAVYACITLKASDIAKLRIKLIQQTPDGIWEDTENAAYSPVLKKPNHYQTRQQFIEQWMVSKFVHGNTYVLKQRNNRGGERQGNVTALYVLDPCRVRVLVAPNGDVFYQLSSDPLSTLEQAIVVPASEIIHDVMVPLYHPLCGVSALTACGIAALQGLKIQHNSLVLFENGSQPSGVLSTPQDIDDTQARDIQTRWHEQFSGANAAKVAVIGLDMKYQPMMMNAVDSELIKQLEWGAEQVCSANHVPPYMIGVGPMPTYTNIEALNQQYYSQALQSPIEHLEALLDEGLELPTRIGTELDLDGLLRMDTSTRMAAAEKAMTSGMAPNEVRLKFHGLGKVVGGEVPYLQQQNFSLSALAKRDAQDDPFASKQAPAAVPPAVRTPPDDDEDEDASKDFAEYYRKALVA